MKIKNLEMNDFLFEVLTNDLDTILEKLREEYLTLENELEMSKLVGVSSRTQRLGALVVAKKKETIRVIRQSTMSYLLNEVLIVEEMTILSIQEIERNFFGTKTHIKYYDNDNFKVCGVLHRKHPQGTKLKRKILKDLYEVLSVNYYNYMDNQEESILILVENFYNRLLKKYQEDFLFKKEYYLNLQVRDYRYWKIK